MLSVHIFRCHGQDVTILLAFETGGVIAAVGIHHALGERTGVHKFGQRRGIVAVLLVEQFLGANDNAHVGQCGGFGVGASGIASEFWCVSGTWALVCGGRGSCVLGK